MKTYFVLMTPPPLFRRLDSLNALGQSPPACPRRRSRPPLPRPRSYNPPRATGAAPATPPARAARAAAPPPPPASTPGRRRCRGASGTPARRCGSRESPSARSRAPVRPAATATLTVLGSPAASGARPRSQRRDGPARAASSAATARSMFSRRHQRLVPLEVQVRVGRQCSAPPRPRGPFRSPLAGDVMTASPPASRTHAAMRESSVATTTRSTFRPPRGLPTCRTMGRPARGARGFPGNLTEA